jgi:hypothetical protein
LVAPKILRRLPLVADLANWSSPVYLGSALSQNPATAAGQVAVSELLSLASLALFVWLPVGLIRFGPWAMKKPGN